MKTFDRLFIYASIYYYRSFMPRLRASALIGRKRAGIFAFSQGYQPIDHAVAGKIEGMDIFRIPEPENDLKITPGFVAGYFSGSPSPGGLSHISVFTRAGPSREQGYDRFE